MVDARQRPSRSKVLLLAYSCAPNRGSEPGIGWNRALETAKYFDTWVITFDREFADQIRGYMKDQGEIPGLHLVFVANWYWARSFWRKQNFSYLLYNLWHRRAYKVAQRLHRQIGFDLIHQLTITGFREPGYLWKLDAPFVWGPIGGTSNYPWRFLGEAGLIDALTEGLRSVLNHIQLRFSSRVRHAASRAKLILAANSTIQRDFECVHRVKPILMLETGIHSAPVSKRCRDFKQRELHILWSGVLEPRKGLSLLLKALPRLGMKLSYELRILGIGRSERRWQRMARRLNVACNVTWMGWLPHHQTLDQYRWADVFVFTSLRDSTGTVVLEALAAGVPVICLDHQGVHDIVTEDCGIKIPVTVPGEVVNRLSAAILTLAQDRVLWERLSDGALLRAKEYTWSRHGERMAALYRNMLGKSACRRDMPPTSDARNGDFGRHVLALRDAAKNIGKRAAGLIALSIERAFNVRVDGLFGILLYHRVAPHVRGVAEPSLNVTPQRFREQIAGLMDRGYVIRPLSEVLRNRKLGLPPPPRTVVVTFDDGFASVYARAWPVLKEFKAPATIFLNTAFMDSGEPFPFDRWGLAHRQRLPAESYRPLTSAECREMAQDGLVELGSHTHTHLDFRSKPAEIIRDTQISIDMLRKRFGLEEVSFAFPGGRRHLGQSGEELMMAVKKTSVTCALTTDPAPVDWRRDPFGWGRFNVYPWDTAATLRAKLNGCYGWAPKLQERLSLRRSGQSPWASGSGMNRNGI